jgi:hypothetical protein
VHIIVPRRVLEVAKLEKAKFQKAPLRQTKSSLGDGLPQWYS